MKEIDGPGRKYKCEPTEEVTVTLHPNHPDKFSAAYSVNGASSQMVVDNKVKVELDGADTVLKMTFEFESPDGECVVKLAGSSGGSFTDPNDYFNIGGLLTNNWRFDV